ARVWGEGRLPRPADEGAALQALVGRLRRTLGPEAVQLTPGGYRLAADREDVDLYRFDRLTTQGVAALAAGRPADAVPLLDEALALWGGTALADLPDGSDDPLVVRAERRRAEARRARLGADIALGRADTVLAEVTALAATEPLDEPLQALRIRALAASGRPAEALQAYEEIRVRLADRLGTDPGEELRALYGALLTPPPVPPSRGNLRAPLTSFVGREDDLADLAAALREHRLVTLIGPGGAGKTRLALETAATVSPGAWPDGVWAAELAPVRDADGVPETVLTALGAREQHLRLATTEPAARPPLDRLVEHCARRTMLLVLDNCEHLVGPAADLVDTLLTRCPGVRVLATSREPLGVPGEFLSGVGPLPPRTALRLLADRGAAARPGFRTEDDPDACAEICRRLDGLPLALELAAARLRVLTARQIADRLDDRFRLLTTGSRTVLPRQQTLRAVVDWSWDLLDDAERTVLRRLSVFSGGCALPQAEEVCGSGPLAARDVLAALAALVDKSLVVATPHGDDGMRYGLLETVAEYAAERLTEAGEHDTMAVRHLRAYRELARTGEPELRGPRQRAWMDRLEREHDNIRAALRTSVDHAEEQEGLCLILSLHWFWQQRGHQQDVHIWSSAVAALGPDPFEPLAPDAGASGVLVAPGVFDGRPRPAEPCPRGSTSLPPPWPEPWLWEARRGVRLTLLASQGVTDEAIGGLASPATQERLRRIVAAYRPELPQIVRQPASLWFFVRLMAGELTSLLDAVDAYVTTCERHGGGWDLGFALLMRARLCPAHAPGDADRALRLFEEAGDDWGVAEALSARGTTYEREERYEEAAADYERAMRSSAGAGVDTQALVFRSRLARLRLSTAVGDEERGRAERELVAIVASADDYAIEVVGAGRILLAHHFGGTGRTAVAREQLDALEAALTPSTPGFFRGLIQGTQAWLDCLDGGYANARARSAEAVGHLDVLAYLVVPQLIADHFLCAAWAMAHLTPYDGARLLAAYDAHERQPGGIGLQPFDDEHTTRRRAETDLRAALGDARFTQAYEEGLKLSVREATTLI
ncbi:ATP-binding protein, partial [Streptomyces sp. NPDC057638]|uniref:ATP-binding protein n=1 Tax=Streptomyces sp. NPDC057638 TaxID=3346190 RepID=UPI0036CA9D11